MLKKIRKVDKLNPYNGLSSNISFFIQGRTSSNKHFFEFFYISAIEEIDKTMVKM